jgi:hypothetical protein
MAVGQGLAKRAVHFVEPEAARQPAHALDERGAGR